MPWRWSRACPPGSTWRRNNPRRCDDDDDDDEDDDDNDTTKNQAQLLTPQAKADIQGFVTSGFGHLPHSAYLFVAFGERAPARAWLKELLPQVTTAASWRVRSGEPKAKPPRTLNVALTAAGLAALGLSEAALRTFPPEFREGMASPQRARILGDRDENAPENWEFGGPDQPSIHGVLILHAATRPDLNAWCASLRKTIKHTQGGVVELEMQYGLKPEHGKEPFGFLDGIAQPAIKGIKGAGVNTGEFILGYQNEYGYHPASPVVGPDEDPRRVLPASANPHHQRAAYRDLGLNGTYMVYRKLRQDVAGFWQFLQAEAVRQGGKADPQFMVWLAAKMVGRWPSGAPLVLAPDHDRPDLGHQDDFLYAQSDPKGLACPFGSHIRRSNPRDMIRPAGPEQSLHMTARHRILRRGRVFGPPLFDLTILDHLERRDLLRTIVDLQDDGKSRGIHFVCVNTSIKSQFEFVQQAWVNNPHFNGLVDNSDPFSAVNSPTARGASAMSVPGYPTGLRTAPLSSYITMRGGAYFFMPGLTALRFLCEDA